MTNRWHWICWKVTFEKRRFLTLRDVVVMLWLPCSGCVAFAQALCRQEKDSATILRKQSAIKELTSKIDFIQNFQANGISSPENGHEAKALQACR